MDKDMKKIALRMIPYGLYVLTAENEGGDVAAATINWVTQASFEPPLIVVCIKADSFTHRIIKDSGYFALNVLGKGQQSLAFVFFKHLEREGNAIGGEPFRSGITGSPILESTPAFIECKVIETLENGDHTIFVGQMVDVGVAIQPQGRPDDETLWLKDLGKDVFYGG